MTTHCPDCLSEVPVRKPGKDGRCDWCRPQAQVRRGMKARRYWLPPGTPLSQMDAAEWHLRRTFLGVSE